MKTPFTSRRFDVFVLVVTVFGVGGLVGSLTAKPEAEVVTVSRDVPVACVEAIDAGFDGLTAQRRADQYRDKAADLAADLTLATLAIDATGIEDALTPMAKQNALEGEWRVNQDEARQVFIDSANQCLALDTAAEAVHDR